ncbi:helix-turn-helix domain-containing protein [Tessaracoccus massiliensis]|uniref:helix-turn-helix domain-containing protein n=1 Tax=Tessaracoccus massiliensis TaxID=1522311 RepID=UPI00058F315D|nr:helix-turn-helix domain-containing protein [Tessaracoccus massiliensis]
MTRKASSPQASLTAPEPVLTVAQVAEHLQLTELTVRRMISAGDLRAYRYGARAIRIDPADLRRMRRPVTSMAGHREAVEAAREEEANSRLAETVERRMGGVA